MTHCGSNSSKDDSLTSSIDYSSDSLMGTNYNSIVCLFLLILQHSVHLLLYLPIALSLINNGNLYDEYKNSINDTFITVKENNQFNI